MSAGTVGRLHGAQEHLNQIVDEPIIGKHAWSTTTIQLARPVCGGSTDEDNANVLASPPEVTGDLRIAPAEEIPGFMTSRLFQDSTDCRWHAFECPRQIGPNLQVGPLPPPSLGKLRDGANDGFGSGSGLSGSVRASTFEEDRPSLRQFRHMASEYRPQHLIAVAEVIVDCGCISLVGGPNDLGDGDIVDAPLGKESRRGVN